MHGWDWIDRVNDECVVRVLNHCAGSRLGKRGPDVGSTTLRSTTTPFKGTGPPLRRVAHYHTFNRETAFEIEARVMAPEQRMDGFDRRQQLPKSMEHIRYAITVEPLRGKKSGNDETHESIEAVGDASIRSHSASHDQKRSDPFMFGSRYLEEGDDVYEFNAWDHVEVDDSYRDFAEEQYARQRDAPVSDFDRCRTSR